MGSKELILIVDDNEDNCEILKEFLESLDYRIETARDGKAGLEKFFSIHPRLMILDLRMPVMDGFEVLERVREKDSTTPVIVVSAQTNIEEVRESIQKGASDYVTKPIELDDLVNKVQKYLSS